MLVIVTKDRILSPQEVCKGCLLANREGLPRWHEGKLKCAKFLEKSPQNQPTLYKCQMGFSLVIID